jgi:hypothetical protein
MDRIALLKGMRDEIAALEKALADDPRHKQLAALQAAVAVFDGGIAASGFPISDDSEEDPANKEIRAFLRERDWTPKNLIFKHLISKGLQGDAEDPKKALGKRMWRMKDIEGDGRGNYRLKLGA